MNDNGEAKTYEAMARLSRTVRGTGDAGHRQDGRRLRRDLTNKAKEQRRWKWH